MTAAASELVVLLDEDGHAIGTAPKRTTHRADTPLHLAFSCYVFNRRGELLVTRRALDKATFPGVWTNSFCGHPAPGEDILEAVRRRGEQELGLMLEELRLVLPAFRYEATMPDGIRENEMCPVFVAVTSSVPTPDASEVAAAEWTPWSDFRDDVLTGQREVSVWCAQQVAALTERERRDGSLAAASLSELPPAARPA
jgi:isopentenyl-diphosphate delta-isomerase